MRKIGAVVALTAAVACVAVFGMKFVGSSSSLGGIAVVDLDKVAAATGKSQEMRDALRLQENSYKQQLVGFRNAAVNQLQTEAKELEEKDEKGAEEAKRGLLAKAQNANNILAKAQNEAGTALNQMYQVQIAKFRAELKPMVQEAAAKRGLSVVIPKNDGLLLSVEPGVDITDDVIKAYQAKRPTPTTQTAAAPAAAPAQPAAAPAKATAEKPAATEDAPVVEKAPAARSKSKNRAAARDNRDADSEPR